MREGGLSEPASRGLSVSIDAPGLEFLFLSLNTLQRGHDVQSALQAEEGGGTERGKRMEKEGPRTANEKNDKSSEGKKSLARGLSVC